MDNLILTIILSALGSAGFFTFIQFLISRKDKKEDEHKDIKADILELKEDIKTIKEQLEVGQIVLARNRIWNFANEILHDVKHSQESFEGILDDVKSYEDYCESHPKFLNGKTPFSIALIKKTYEHCLDNHDFLKGEEL